MSRMLYVITETRPNLSHKFYYQFISENFVRHPNAEDNNDQVFKTFAIYNLEQCNMTDEAFIHEGEPHHHEDGTPCEEICICGPMFSKLSEDGLTYQTFIKSHSDDILELSDPELDDFKEHLNYNEVHEITYHTEWKKTDSSFNILE